MGWQAWAWPQWVVSTMARLVLFNKPFDVLCQFSDGGETPVDGRRRPTLKDYLPIPGVYPAGRLDRDSEGLLLLTDHGGLQHAISDPRHKLPKTYLVQVEGNVDAAAIAALSRGVTLNDGPTRPAEAEALPEPELWPRDPPVRFRKSVPDSWLKLVLREGRNRQVRRMTAAVGFPTLRLVRWQIGPWSVEGLAPGEYRVLEVDPAEWIRGEGQRHAGIRREGSGQKPRRNTRARPARR